MSTPIIPNKHQICCGVVQSVPHLATFTFTLPIQRVAFWMCGWYSRSFTMFTKREHRPADPRVVDGVAVQLRRRRFDCFDLLAGELVRVVVPVFDCAAPTAGPRF